MIIVFGHYPLLRKRIAYRKDWCNACEAECHAERFRTFRLGYLYWIPVLPLGFWRTWECATCGKDPRVRTRESITTLILALVLCAVFFAAMLFVDAKPDDQTGMWAFRLIMLAAMAGLGWTIRKRLREKPVQKTITPYPKETCYYCQGRLTINPPGHCNDCNVDLAAS